MSDRVQAKEARSPNLDRLIVEPKSGRERFNVDGENLGFSLYDFWRWSVSDLVSNATRGRLAEFIVAKALGISTEGVRDEWGAYDLKTPKGKKIEVKSAAYVQSWYQTKFSPISFRTPKTHAFDPQTAKFEAEPKWQADVYVFAVLAHRDQSPIDPTNLDQWEFYAVSTRKLDERKRSQYGLTLSSLTNELSAERVSYTGLRAAVDRALQEGPPAD